MSSMNFTCDSCGREVFGCTFVNGMKFCAKCYQETFGETDKDRKIADLEAKLAEKDKTITTLVEDSKTSKELLKKQLSEKDKEIAYMTKQAKKFNNEAQKYYEDAYCNDFQKQTKIDFAVEQLEKLKVELHIIHTNGYLKAIDEEIDNQINRLKGEK